MAHRSPPTAQSPAGADAIAKARPVGQVAPAAAVDPASRVDSVEKAAAAVAVSPAAPVAGVEKTAPAAAADRIRSIAERLRQGSLSPDQTVEELVEDAVQRSLPGLESGSKLSQELRALLLAYAKDDPYLASRIGRLGIQR
jgi:parvulin-like peptidyl-prolyl isomerase